MGAADIRTVAIVTDPEMPELQPDDAGLPAAFAAQGVRVEVVPWGRALPPERCDAALVRTPWEYFRRPAAFLRWVSALPVPVLNPAGVLRWNHDKRYLLELAESGAARIPPTALVSASGAGSASEALLEQLGVDRAVLKPTVSGGAWRTVVVERGAPALVPDGATGDFLLQGFVEELLGDGEWSLTFLGGSYSHAVRKRARSGDFRVQEEHGGTVEVVEPPMELLEEAARVLAAVPGGAPLTYARVDLVRAGAGRPYLMELELIEPELFLRAKPGAEADLVAAVLADSARAGGTSATES